MVQKLSNRQPRRHATLRCCTCTAQTSRLTPLLPRAQAWMLRSPACSASGATGKRPMQQQPQTEKRESKFARYMGEKPVVNLTMASFNDVTLPGNYLHCVDIHKTKTRFVAENEGPLAACDRLLDAPYHYDFGHSRKAEHHVAKILSRKVLDDVLPALHRKARVRPRKQSPPSPSPFAHARTTSHMPARMTHTQWFATLPGRTSCSRSMTSLPATTTTR